MSDEAQVAQQLTCEAKIIRANGDVEDLGVIGFYHHNPIRMWLWEHGHRHLALLGVTTDTKE